MHPAVRRQYAGACPRCGMALEPERVTATPAPNAEYRAMKQRFWWALALALPVFGLEMCGHMVPAFHHLMIAVFWPGASQWAQAVLAKPVVLGAGWSFFVRGLMSLRNGQLNMFTLVAMGMGIALGYSMVALRAPGAFFRPNCAMGRAWLRYTSRRRR
jgi:cation transport ATPase